MGIPYEIMFGRRANNLIEEIIEFPENRTFDYNTKLRLVQDNILNKAELRKNRFERKYKGIKYNIGHKVLCKTHYQSSKLDHKIQKLFLLYQGPFIISDIKRENAYTLKYVDKDEIFGVRNVTELTKFYE